MRVGIIGGGAAGLMCAAAVFEADPSVDIFLLERNEGLGKKVIISGGGRCNVTTGIQDVKMLLTKYPRGSKFLTTAMYAFPPEAVYEWFESHGVPLKNEPDNRVFPISDDGHDVVRAFEELFAMTRVQIMLGSNVTSVAKEGDEFLIYRKDTVEPLKVDKLVLTTGGQAYRHTGSTGDGYAFALALGQTITPLAPSLNAFFTKEKWTAKVSGIAFENATITAKLATEKEFTGPFLFTHKGVSGPAVFALSSLVAFKQYNAESPLPITIDLYPDDSIDELTGKIDVLRAVHGHKQFSNVLAMLVPKSLSEVVIHELGLSETKPANEFSKKDVSRCAGWLKAIPLNVVQRGAGDEFVTAGGVQLLEVDPTTMESKVCPGLYFAGEILDVDGFTGGFNLQASWATGYLAGTSLST